MLQRIRYSLMRMGRRHRAFGLIGLRLHLMYRGWRIWKRSDTELPGVGWLIMWRQAPWYEIWHMGRKRNSVERARRQWDAKRMAGELPE